MNDHLRLVRDDDAAQPLPAAEEVTVYQLHRDGERAEGVEDDGPAIEHVIDVARKAAARSRGRE